MAIFSTRSLEPQSTKEAVDLYERKLGKKVFFVGPGSRTTTTASSILRAALKPFKPIFDFLDAQKPKSVILISFGTLFFPSQEWQLETVLKCLIDTQTPFIFSRAPRLCRPFDDELEKAIAESGLGMVVDFVPQQAVLEHPSLGAFLAHGGFNSLFESIMAGVLNIYWPFVADQPVHAAIMSQKVRINHLPL